MNDERKIFDCLNIEQSPRYRPGFIARRDKALISMADMLDLSAVTGAAHEGWGWSRVRLQ